MEKYYIEVPQWLHKRVEKYRKMTHSEKAVLHILAIAFVWKLLQYKPL